MFEELGANLYKPEPKVTLDEVNILHVPIFVTLDACHLLKLARNCFGDFKVITNDNFNIFNFSSPNGYIFMGQGTVAINVTYVGNGIGDYL